jgi:hypothetical protein
MDPLKLNHGPQLKNCCCWLIATLRVYVPPPLSVEATQRYVYGSSLLNIRAHTRLFVCTYVHVNQTLLFCHISGGWNLFGIFLRHCTFGRSVSSSVTTVWCLEWNSVLNEQIITSHPTGLLAPCLGRAVNNGWDIDDDALFLILSASLIVKFPLILQWKLQEVRHVHCICVSRKMWMKLCIGS